MTKFSNVLDELGRARADSRALLRALQVNVHTIEEQVKIAVELDERLRPLGDRLVDARLDEQELAAAEKVANPTGTRNLATSWNALDSVRKAIGEDVQVLPTLPEDATDFQRGWNQALDKALGVVRGAQRALTHAEGRSK